MSRHELGRRRFLAGVLGFAGGFLTHQELPHLIPQPETPIAKEKTDFTLYPGWIEEPIKSDFLKRENGHLDWLRQAALSNEVVNIVMQQSFRYLLDNEKAKTHVRFGDMFTQALQAASTAIDKIAPDKIKSGTNVDLEKIHATVIGFTVPLMTWWSDQDLQNFGMRDSEERLKFTRYWYPDGIGTILPELFGRHSLEFDETDKKLSEKGLEPKYKGTNITVHAANHLLIAFEYLYSKSNNLRTHQTIDPILQLDMIRYGNLSRTEGARAFSKDIGKLYKLQQLKDSNSWPFVTNQEDLHQGPFAEEVKYKLKGNTFGTDAGIHLFLIPPGKASLTRVINALNNPIFADSKTIPRLEIAA